MTTRENYPNSGQSTVLVTGGTGYVASFCIVELLNAGWRVRTTVRDGAKTPGIKSELSRFANIDGLEFAVADLDAEDGWNASLTHYCGWIRHGRLIVSHKTDRKHLTRKLKALRREVWRFMHTPLATPHESGSPPFCVDTMATMAGRTTIRRSTASTRKCVEPGCAV
jgi:hypothetical protein